MSEIDIDTENQENQLTPEQQKAQNMADCAEIIRSKAKEEKYISFTGLCAALAMEAADAESLLSEMKELDAYNDIFFYAGEKDKYYYSYPTLAHNYVKNVALAEEGDIVHTIADIVRYESKTYPRATTYDTFTKFPYRYTMVQIKNAVGQMLKLDAYSDIQTYESKQKHCLYLFSTQYLTPSYASALVERAEDYTLWQ